MNFKEKQSVKASPVSIAFSWLLVLRWGAVACQVLLILAVSMFFDIAIPLGIVSFILAFQGASNLYFLYLTKWKTIPDWLFYGVMFMDVGLLTVLLYYTGGPMNPFTFLFLIHVVLGSILMRPRWAWALTFFAVFCYAGFFYPGWGFSSTSPWQLLSGADSNCHDVTTLASTQESHMKLHLQGMWFAYALTSFFIVFFVSRIQGALENHQRLVRRLQEEKVRNEKLASLATLAAGAAHEFSTPLSTIAVAAGEMLYSLKGRKGEDQLRDDARLIRQQVDTCKEIIFQMAADAGENLGEAVEQFELRALIKEALESFLSDKPDAVVTVIDETENCVVSVPYRTFIRTVKGLLKNAYDASQAAPASIKLSCRADTESLYIEVEDGGKGMEPEILEKAGEPFFTTKEAGQGLGLGLYLSRSFAERLGGTLSITSEPGRGTKVVIRLPLERIFKAFV